MKDSKHLLKEAREAIKNKNFEVSLKLSKSILKEDKTNYMALVFLGLSLQEVGPKDQALKAFQKAIELNSSNSLAWNGLINYYEKLDSNETKPELVKLYIKILEIEQSEKKLVEYCEKLSSLYQHGDVQTICTAMYDIMKNKKVDKDCKTAILDILIALIANLKETTEDLLDLYEQCLLEIINDPNTRTAKYYSDYLTLLHKQKKTEELLDHAEKMHNLYESDLLSLGWICKIFNQSYVEGNVLANIYYDKMEDVMKKILNSDKKNPMALFTKSILLLGENKIIEAKENLVEVTIQRPGLMHAWLLLTEVYVKMHLYDAAFESVQKTDKLLSLINYSNVSLKDKLDVLRIQVLSHSNGIENWNEALELYKNMEDETIRNKCLTSVFKVKLNLAKYEEAKLLISDIKNFDKELYNLLTAKLLHKQKSYREALDILEKHVVDSCEYWLEIGLLHWSLEEYSDCLVPFLKAAKCDPNNFTCFLHLGNYYSKVNDYDKARRCYEKAFKINPRSSETVNELSKIYRKQKNWDANVNLLQSLTNGPINKNNMWAYLQLGLNYLEQEDYVKAIENLRLVVRIDTENVHSWESLADAYFARGAYTSALKCYQKASDLSENALYPSLQVANIKKILGEYPEARAAFEEILLRSGLYVPALKGLAETCMYQARDCYKEQRLGTARDHAQHALEKLTLAIQQRSELSCLWKLLADSCFFVVKLPEKFSCLLVPKFILEGNAAEGNTIMEKEELYDLATRCYSKAITLVQDNIWLWHDLATCYLYHALNTEDSNKNQQLFNYALAAAQHCISSNPSSWQHWNLLGNVAMMKTPPNYGLAQHAFIKAVMADHNSAVSWTNLGVLYLFVKDIKLANQAFSQGQRSDPNYVNCWIGQAMIAEGMGHEEAMDLFRHSTQLDHHQQGGLGYGHWVCQTLLGSPPNAVIYSIDNMHAISVACDALTWYIEKNSFDGCAWNILGILKERLGLKKGACQAFRNAYRLSPNEFRDKAKINYGRLLIKVEKYVEAIDMFRDVQEATFNSGTGLALSLFKDKQYEESYDAYDQALNWLTEEQTFQSELLVGLASIAYMFQGSEAAKTLLFQSIDLKPPSPWSLYATLALGLLHEDQKLAVLVLNELENFKDNKECIPHYVVLLSNLYLLKGEHQKAIKEVSKLVHRHPAEPSVWLTLAVLLLRLRKKRKPSQAATKCALVAMKLGQANMDITKVLCLVSLASLVAGDHNQALIAAQKAVHCYPDNAECWAVLTCVLLNKKGKTVSNNYIIGILQHIENLSHQDKLIKWSKNLQQVVK